MTAGSNIDDELLSFAFSLHSNPNSYALLLGAGVSMPSVPGAWEVLMELIRGIAAARDDPEPAHPDQWYRETFHQEPRYDSVLEQIAPTQQERQQVLRRFFEPPADDSDSGAGGPTPAHRAIARLVKNGAVRVIMTLNFDHLLETALRDEGIQPTVVSTPGQMAGMSPLHTLQCCIVHLHGDYLDPASMLNTGAELAEYHDTTKDLISRVLRDYGLLIAGWSATWDSGLRELIDQHYPNRYTMGWIEPRMLTDLAGQLLQRQRGTLITATADDAFGRLADGVDALRVRRTRHPLTVAVAAGTAKRELSGERTAIGLHDTVRSEMERLHRIFEFNLPDYRSADLYGGYPQLRARVKEQSSMACALVAVLAHWGTPDTDRWWLSEVPKFASWEVGDGGATDLLALTKVTGTALCYSAGVAATAAQRWPLVLKLFQLPVSDTTNPQNQLGDLGADRWANIPTALYQYLHPVLDEALALGHGALDDAWQLFEVLRALHALLANPQTKSAISAYLSADANFQYIEAQFQAPESAISQGQRSSANEVRGRELGKIASLVLVGSPHIYASRFDDPTNGLYTAPVVTQLVHAVRDGDHPLIAAIGWPAAELQAALLAVGLAISREAEQAAQRGAIRRAPSGAAWASPNTVWLDTESSEPTLGAPKTGP